MKRHFVCILVMLIGLFGFSSISLAEESKWTKKADMPTARFGLSTSVVNGKIFAIGGVNDRFLSIVEEYDPKTDAWTKKADMLTARQWLSTSVVKGKIYAIGGSQRKTAYGAEGPFLSIVEEYDPKTNTWTKKADMPSARELHSIGVVNGKIYAIGGFGAGSIVEEYDPATDKWRKKADMPTARSGHSTSMVNEKIYAIGGFDSSFNGLSTVEKYDPKTDTWTKKADMPTARLGLSTSAMNGKIYAIGGVVKVSFGNGVPSLSTVEEYDTGFSGVGIEAKGKFITLWGKIKHRY